MASSIFKVLLNEAVPSRDSRTIGIAYVYSLLKGCAVQSVSSSSKPVVAEAQNLFTVLNNLGTYKLNSLTSFEGIPIPAENSLEEKAGTDSRQEPIEEMSWGYVEDIAGFLAAYSEEQIPGRHIEKYFRSGVPERGSRVPNDGIVTREEDGETVIVNQGTVEKAVIDILRLKGVEAGIEYIGKTIKRIGMPVVDSKKKAEEHLPTYVGASTYQAREQAATLYALAPECKPSLKILAPEE